MNSSRNTLATAEMNGVCCGKSRPSACALKADRAHRTTGVVGFRRGTRAKRQITADKEHAGQPAAQQFHPADAEQYGDRG
jgi:hypothetical protein